MVTTIVISYLTAYKQHWHTLRSIAQVYTHLGEYGEA